MEGSCDPHVTLPPAHGVQESSVHQQVKVHAGRECIEVCGLSEGTHPRDPAGAAERYHPTEVRGRGRGCGDIYPLPPPQSGGGPKRRDGGCGAGWRQV